MRRPTRRPIHPVGTSVAQASRDRARRSDEYRQAGEEYGAIRELRKKNWIAAHVRQLRYELDLTHEDVAERAGTSLSCVKELEDGDHLPTIPELTRVLSALGEKLLIGIELPLLGDDDEPEREIAPPPDVDA